MLLLLAPYGGSAQQDHHLPTIQVEIAEAVRSGQTAIPLDGVFPESLQCDIRIRSWQLRGDSLPLYDVVFTRRQIQQGARQYFLIVEDAGVKKYVNQEFIHLLQAFRAVPPGQYVSEVILQRSDSVLYRKFQSRHIDSTLAHGSVLRRQLNGFFKKKGMDSLGQRSLGAYNTPSAQQLEQSGKKISRGLRSLKGLSGRPVTRNGRTYTELYYQDWFMGRYELASVPNMQAQAAREQQVLQDQASAFVESNLEDFRSVGGQIRQLYGNSKEHHELEGRLDWNNTFSTATDPNSQVDPNYSEVHGIVGTKVMEIPVQVEGYYTTQDLNRKIKASYLRFSYDADKAREELMNLIMAYRQKYAEAAAKGTGLEQIYAPYLERLKGEKAELLSSVGRDYGINGSQLSASDGDPERLVAALPEMLDTTGLRQKLVQRSQNADAADSAIASLQKEYQLKRQKLVAEKEKVKERYEQLKDLEQKLEKYRTLTTQYREGLLLDSALRYSKLDRVVQDKDASYKDMAKAAQGLLPEGKVKRFTTGLSHLEAGMLHRYESAYTLAGQTLKGLSVGYDLGFATATISAGKSEYISRDGNLDRYNSYSAGLQFRKIREQRVGVFYYGYSPTRQMTNDAFFKKADIAVPTFRRPVHIVALTHQGIIGKQLSLEAEGAVSVKRAERQTVGMSNAALKLGGQYQVTQINATLKAEIEHMGADFENSSLPLTRAGTERYMAGMDIELFGSFLTLGITWNQLIQHNFSSTGTNRRWGFEAKTHSRRYPNIAISYKPFSTFRAYDDTLSVPQRPLSGEVWTGRGSYQLKRGKRVHRFTLLYNRNSTNGGDSLRYSSTTAQAGYHYSALGNNYGLGAGMMQLPVLWEDGSGYGSGTSWFINGSAGRAMGKKLNVQLSQDLGVAVFGLQRLSTTLGGSYSLAPIPIVLRASVRYTYYKLTAGTAPGTLWAGQMGLGWHFRTKLHNQSMLK